MPTAYVVPYRARSIQERGVIYRAGRPTIIRDETLYHHLMRTGNFRDWRKTFSGIRHDSLERVPPGSVVTVIREGGLGDVLMVLIVMRAMKKRFPHLRFRLATGSWFIPIFRGIDWLEPTECLMDMTGHISNAIDLRGLAENHPMRETRDRIDIFAATCGVEVKSYRIPITLPNAEERAHAREILGEGPVIALAVRGSTHVRTWPLGNVQSFATLAALRGWTVAAIDSDPFPMPDLPNIRNLTGKASLLDVLAVIAESEFCVSSDSGLQHLAEAVGTKCLAIYSTTPPALRISHYRHVKALWRAALPCVPCFDRGCPAAPCMHIAPEDVMRALEDYDALEMATDVDSVECLKKLAPWIAIQDESKIMSDWVRQSLCA